MEALRALRVARRSAVKARTRTANQIQDLLVTAPESVRARLRVRSAHQRVAICAVPSGPATDPGEATRTALRSLAFSDEPCGVRTVHFSAFKRPHPPEARQEPAITQPGSLPASMTARTRPLMLPPTPAGSAGQAAARHSIPLWAISPGRPRWQA